VKRYLVVSFVVAAVACGQGTVGSWDLAALYETPKWEQTELAAKAGMTGILYEGLVYEGKPAQVFAYYSAPAGEAPEDGWPAIVCVHGGGGTAFEKWVRLWNKHGYAAISMDLEGHLPLKTKGGKGRQLTPTPGPSRLGVFAKVERPLAQQWYFHAVAQIIAGHSLIRSFPEVNAEQTVVHGISWGGTLTSTVMGVDTRFKCAIPVYGCGFLSDSDGHQGRAIADGAHADFVNEHYDGSGYFENVTYPTFWVNGTNDFHFSMPATQASARAVQGPATLRFGLRMKHGHLFDVAEYFAFADSVLKDGEPLLELGKPQANGNAASVTSDLLGQIKGARLLYTLDDDIPWPDKEWQATPATVDGSEISAELLPGTVAFFFEATDKRGLLVSSEYLEHEVPGGKKPARAVGETLDFAALFDAAAAEGAGTKVIIADDFEEGISAAVIGILEVDDAAGKAGISHCYDEVAAGGKSLQITNSRTVKHRHQPCLSQWFKGADVIRSGTVEVSFDVWVPKAGGHPLSVLVRDYTTKPSQESLNAACTFQGVRVNGKSMAVANDEWVHYAMALPVGIPDAKIALTVVDTKFGTRKSEHPIEGGTAQAVSWMGLCLGGKSDATIYLDNLVIKVVE